MSRRPRPKTTTRSRARKGGDGERKAAASKVANRRLLKNPLAALQKAVEHIEGGDPASGFELAKMVLRATGHEDAAKVGAFAALRMDPESAVSALAQLNKLRPNDPGLLNDFGGVLCQTGAFERAEKAFRKAVQLRPGHVQSLANLGQALVGVGKFEDAKAAFEAVLEKEPGFAPGYSGLASVFEVMDDFEQAISAHRKALDLDPANRALQDNLENAYLMAGKGQADREAMYRKFLSVDADDPGTLLALGGAVYDQGRAGEAKEIFRRVLELDVSEKQEARAKLALGEIAFLQGDAHWAWSNYHWRFRTGDVDVRAHQQPRWQGEDLAGKKILVWEEQGLGECLMYMQFVRLLAEAGAQVVYEAKPRFAPVLRAAYPEFEVIEMEDSAVVPDRPDIDYQCAVGDLGQWLWDDFQSRREALGPRFRSDQSAAYRSRYIADSGIEDPKMLVGIAWSSKVSRLGPTKSLRLTDLAPILEMPDIVFVDLQYGDTKEEIEAAESALGCRILHDYTFDQRQDLVSFFAQVGALDAVVTISNTTLHVAGSIGIPTAGLLSTVPMWRWEFERDSAVWYPSVQLYRQQAPGDWSAPVAEAQHFLNTVG